MGIAYIVDEAGSLLLRWGWALFLLLTGDGTLYNTAGLNGERKHPKQLLHLIGDDEEYTRKPYCRSLWAYSYVLTEG